MSWKNLFYKDRPFNEKDHRQAAQSVFVHSVKWLSNIVAVIITYFLTPLTYQWSAPGIRAFSTHFYMPELAGLAVLIWSLALVAIIFFTCRAALSALFATGGLAIATRFF